MTSRTYDIFITHSWRFHEPWNRTVQALDSIPALRWRNFSVPWYDPALDPNTPFGKEKVDETVTAQILPSNVVLFLADVYAIKSTKKWIDMELAIAEANNIPVVAIYDKDASEYDTLPRTKFSGQATYEPKALYRVLLDV